VDASVEMLSRISVRFAMAGADVIAPSDMMDGRVGVIKEALHQAGFGSKVEILKNIVEFRRTM
jgi:porphobilinogen synthase